VNNPGDVADLDMLLSDAFFYLSRQLELGEIYPASLKSRPKLIIWTMTPYLLKVTIQAIFVDNSKNSILISPCIERIEKY
jgi:hypothetical protein